MRLTSRGWLQICELALCSPDYRGSDGDVVVRVKRFSPAAGVTEAEVAASRAEWQGRMGRATGVVIATMSGWRDEG